jgi:CheY-like chemotaxis protein
MSLPLLPLRVAARDTPERVHPTAPTNADLNCPVELDGLHILIVDDEADTRDMLEVVLAKCGARVTTATSAADALMQIADAQPDIIISDIGMPDEDGYRLIEQIRTLSLERGGMIPAVALTAYARPEDRVRALRAGFQMHVPKPVEPAEIIAVVANLARRNFK